LAAGLLSAAMVPGTVMAQPVLNDALSAAHQDGGFPGLHAVLVRYGNETLAEVYFRGEDERWGQSLGVREHGPDVLHDIRSVTKSIVGLLYGIALSDGKVPPPEAPLIAQFPEYADLFTDPKRAEITVAHALSMKMGTEWNEDLPYTDPNNSEIAMELAEDRYRFALDRPMVTDPGDWWHYNGGALALLGKLIEDGTGQDLEAYAAEVLFEPLGIEEYEWIRGADGVASAASGLRLTVPGLARIGDLILQNGVWKGRQIVPAEWLETSFTPRADLDQVRYGYLWWLANWGDPPAWVAGCGNGGQRLTVQAEHDLVVVVLTGNYNDPDAWRLPARIVDEYVSPEIRRRLEK
jgi:CubicO group peptidase (beta-lactamase class C family)